MASKFAREALVLSAEQETMLKELEGLRTAAVCEVERAKVMLGYAVSQTTTQFHRQLGAGRPMIYKCIDKALGAGVQMGLRDKYHRPHAPQITHEAKTWVVALACTKTKDHGLAAEL